MFKRILYILLVVSVITVSFIYHLPSKAVYKALPVFLRVRYGISTKAGLIDGGLRMGIILKNAVVVTKNSTIICDDVVTDIKFIDLLIPRRNYYNVYLEKPKINLRDFQYDIPKVRMVLPFWLKTHISISNAELSVKGLGQKSRILLNGIVEIDKKNLSLHNWRADFGGFEVQLEGNIDRKRELNLEAKFDNSENKFMIKGSLDNPRIYTKWNNFETSFQINDIEYENEQLVFPKVEGSVIVQGFRPIDINGEIRIDKTSIKFNRMTIMKIVKLSGEILRNGAVKLKLAADNVDGAKFAEDLPEAIRIFINAHKVSANIDIFGKMNNLQAGGIMKMQSNPMEINCRYRNNRISFTTIGDSKLNMSGTVNCDEPCSIKIRGDFDRMGINELMMLLGKEPDSSTKGTVEGQFKITGEAASPVTELKLEMQNAEFGSAKFDVAYLNLQGTGSGPFNLQHSMVYYKEIPAELTGYVDFKGDDVLKNVEIRPTAEGFVLEGINIVKDSGGEIVSFGKDVNDKISVSFKSVVTSDPEQGGVEKSPEIEVEYKLKDNKNITLKMQEEEGTVGIKQKMQF